MKDKIFVLTEEQIDQMIKKAQSSSILPDSIASLPSSVSLEKAANDYDVTKRFLYKLHHEGKITLKKLNNRTFVSPQEIEGCMKPLGRKQSA